MSISVIIPAYNAARFVGEAIESVLAQTYPAGEIVVIDDGSVDETAAVASRYAGVRVIRQENRGIGRTRNRGMGETTGELVAFLDADDLWLPAKLQRQVEWLRANPECDMVFTWVTQFRQDEPEKLVGAPMRGIFAGTMLIRRASFARVGEFESQYRVGEFIDWYARAQDLGLRGGIIDEVLLRRRIHGENTGVRERQHQAHFARVAKAALDRRRGMVIG